MENKNIKRINTIGKVSRVVIILFEIVIICGIVGAILAGSALLAMPKDFITVNGNASAEIMIDTDKAPLLLDADDFEELEGADNIDLDFLDVFLDVKVNEGENGVVAINANAGADNADTRIITLSLGVAAFVGAVLLGAILVVAIFGYKLAKAFSTCTSPFEENVITRMKRFGYSLIPWAAITCLSSDSVSLTAVLFAVVVILITQIFSYGAKLQQENDDMV